MRQRAKGLPLSLALLIFVSATAGSVFTAKAQEANQAQVVVYVSHDRSFSQPVLQAFEEKTGITVHAVHDTEETKGSALIERLIAEKPAPKADVYWANAPIRAELLKREGVSAPYLSPNAGDIEARWRDPEGYWTGFAARARVLLVGAGVAPVPASILAYTDPRWRSRSVIAHPRHGTTAEHLAALFVLWGDARGRQFLEKMRTNGVRVTPGNIHSARLVADGLADFALVDTDDALAMIEAGKPVRMIWPDQSPDGLGVFIVPNAAVLIAGAPHPAAARKLIDFLLSREAEEMLAKSPAHQIPLHPNVAPPEGMRSLDQLHVMPIDYAAVAHKLKVIRPLLEEWAASTPSIANDSIRTGQHH
ncbi:MAG: extracellular solute-binding protein [Alphaproteobacteria bacterium]|nr:MAG: extracellular solute-binding protein [Alphaproteobacteria bacterium]